MVWGRLLTLPARQWAGQCFDGVEVGGQATGANDLRLMYK
jgi:hypothetical protein